MSETMKICVICSFPITADMMFYQLSDLSVSVSSVVELNVDGETNQDDTLCESCFNKVLKHTIKYETDLEKTDGETSQAQEAESYIQKVNDSKMEEYEDEKCVWCSEVKRLLYILPESPERDDVAAIIYPKQITEKSNKICNLCWIKAERIMQNKSPENEIVEESDINSNNYIVLPEYRRCTRSSRSCFVLGCTGENKRRAVPLYLRRVLLESYKFYVPKCARVCNEHVKEYYRDWSFLKDLIYIDEFKSDDIEDMMEILGSTK